ncbi:hypothetical protein ZWY2020_009597 [Hordeum vulgare]|nr:hypothetical protein ZWY2020_009597 [Hordeum vulgare]
MPWRSVMPLPRLTVPARASCRPLHPRPRSPSRPPGAAPSAAPPRPGLLASASPCHAVGLALSSSCPELARPPRPLLQASPSPVWRRHGHPFPCRRSFPGAELSHGGRRHAADRTQPKHPKEEAGLKRGRPGMTSAMLKGAGGSNRVCGGANVRVREEEKKEKKL